jgi:probable F420-dependent oxidoreductase
MDLGRLGIWTFVLDLLPANQARDLAAEIEAMGFGALWIPEAVGREAVSNSSLVLSATESIVVATGVAQIWGRDAYAMAGAHRTLSEAHPGRFLLGLGVSHAPMVEGMRHRAYDKPYSAMREYLAAMDGAFLVSPEPPEPPTRVLAALGPRMLALSAEQAGGAHTYFVPPEHTAVAREVLGARPLLAVEQAAVFNTDAQTARQIARTHMATYLVLPNYTNNLRRLGWGDDDLDAGGSDRLVDAIVAWGDLDAIAERVRAHHDAGADHVCVQVLEPAMADLPTAGWRELAQLL